MSREDWLCEDWIDKEFADEDFRCARCNELVIDDECVLVCGLCWPCRKAHEAECDAQEEAYYKEHEAHGGSRAFMESMGICNVCNDFTV